MIFDEAPIINEHLPLIRNGGLGDALVTATRACTTLIERIIVSYPGDKGIAPRTVVDLAARTYTGIGGTGRAIIGGYWTHAIHGLRDLLETAQLIELFRLRPQEADEWIKMKGKQRYERFGFSKVWATLSEIRGTNNEMRGLFEASSNFGSHPSFESFGLSFNGDSTMIGPTSSDQLFKILTLSLWRHAAINTAEIMLSAEALFLEHTELRTRFPMEVAAYKGGCALLRNLSNDHALIIWPHI